MSILPNERAKSNLKQHELIKLVYGSQKRFDEIIFHLNGIKKSLPQDAALKYYEKSRMDKIKYSYEVMSTEIMEKRISVDYKGVPGELYHCYNIVLPGSVSNAMVRPLIALLGTEKQKSKWLPLLDTNRCIGAYAQTELAHGSDIQSLETEALYDQKTDELIINNNKVSSYKWWPGDLGQLSNIAILYAKIIVDNKNIGILPIIVQLRDLETHKILPGVEIGDIGPKLGYNEKENGYLKFTNYRVPKENLLSRFIDFKSTGELVIRGNPKIIYSSMMRVRTSLLHLSSYYLGKALAISIRYSYFRKQFRNTLGIEIPIIDYQLQQHKLIPLVAKAYAMTCNFNQIRKVIEKIEEDVKKSDFSKLQEGHILLSGGKALYTSWCNTGLITCLQCCGGHGFSEFSGIPSLAQTFLPNTILEGENSILLLQVGRYLIKSMGNILKGKTTKIGEQLQYFLNIDHYESLAINASEVFLYNTENLLNIFKKGAIVSTKHAIDHIVINSSEISFLEAFNKKSAITIIEAAKMHTLVFTFDHFIKNIREVNDNESYRALLDLAILFALEQIIENSYILITFDVVDSQVLLEAKNLYEKLLVSIKPNIVVFTDVFAPDDYILYSALGDQNEKPYENLYRMARDLSAINKVDLTKHYLETIRRASLRMYPKL